MKNYRPDLNELASKVVKEKLATNGDINEIAYNFAKQAGMDENMMCAFAGIVNKTVVTKTGNMEFDIVLPEKMLARAQQVPTTKVAYSYPEFDKNILDLFPEGTQKSASNYQPKKVDYSKVLLGQASKDFGKARKKYASIDGDINELFKNLVSDIRSIKYANIDKKEFFDSIYSRIKGKDYSTAKKTANIIYDNINVSLTLNKPHAYDKERYFDRVSDNLKQFVKTASEYEKVSSEYQELKDVRGEIEKAVWNKGIFA